MNNLEKRIAYLESLIYEGKQVGTLYHICSAEKAVRYITQDNVLQSSGNYINKITGSRDIISFTRTKHKKIPFNIAELAKTPFVVRFTVDGDKLSERYKVFPYNDFPDSQGSLRYKSLQQEECVKGPIKNFSKYVKLVEFIHTGMSDKYTDDWYTTNDGRLITYKNLAEWCDDNGIEYSVDDGYKKILGNINRQIKSTPDIGQHAIERMSFNKLMSGHEKSGDAFILSEEELGLQNKGTTFMLTFTNKTDNPVGYIDLEVYTKDGGCIYAEDQPNVADICKRLKLKCSSFSDMSENDFKKFIKNVVKLCGLTRKVKSIYKEGYYVWP